jgi:hypothetical protein
MLQRVPAAYRVCAFYYLGRTELNSDNIAGGIDMLQAAFRECKADSENVKHILRALVPVRDNLSQFVVLCDGSGACCWLQSFLLQAVQ